MLESPVVRTNMTFLFGSPLVEPKLSSLFATKSQPVKQATNTRQGDRGRVSTASGIELNDTSGEESSDVDSSDVESSIEESSDVSSTISDAVDEATNSLSIGRDNVGAVETTATKQAPSLSHDPPKSSRRKRRRDEDDDLEAAYMDRLMKEDVKEKVKRQDDPVKRLKLGDEHSNQGGENKQPASPEEEDDDDYVIPQYESLAGPEAASDLEKASRTVFVGNVAISTITKKSDKRKLLDHLSSFLAELPKSDTPHKIESTRFRSTAFSSSIPKKAAFARQDVMDATSKSTNLYVVYSTKQAAKEAAKRLNGTIALDRHIRVDEVAHPSKVDHHRCVFVGNLGFVDDETQMKANEAAGDEKQQRKPQNGDVEEGLWRQFGKAGTVESVRVVRDPKTRVGKGFAYVQFTDENAVEAALLFNDKKFPPLLPRKVRVVRAKKFKRNATKPSERPAKTRTSKGSAGDPTQQSLRGRVKKMLGRAGAASTRSNGRKLTTNDGKSIKAPETIVFEGNRASSKQGNKGLKLGKASKKKGGRPTNRSAKRGAVWKSKGAKS